jgi:hypothetical protein
VGLSHLVGDDISVDVERGADVRMPHELLLHGNRGSQGVQPRSIAVTGPVRPRFPVLASGAAAF